MSSRRNINDLVAIMETLLSAEGCPWDREQTHQSLAPYAIEEAHELAESLDSGNISGMKEELGDLLLQVVFHCALSERAKTFVLGDVIEGICNKLIHRHPHVFGDTQVKDASEVLENWEQLKNQEKQNKEKGPLDFPKGLPALQTSQKIGAKTKDLKFDWNDSSQVLPKVEEELTELKAAIKSKNKPHIEEELGDLFFVLAQLARHLDLDAETSARKANQKFKGRFDWMIEQCKKEKRDFKSLSLDEKESLWEKAKKHLKS